ncbi:MAG: hypothetical protein ACQSGP_19220, partial [Frankia sp.]
AGGGGGGGRAAGPPPDAATGGPDLARKIYPVVAVVTQTGYVRAPDDEVGTVVDAIVADRMTNPGG